MQDSINKIRRYDIDLLKFIACVMVVILHGIEPGGGIQQIIYLLGSFGIPLFFVVNGYLLSQKYIDFKFANEKLCKYFKFMLLWAVICGIPFSIIEHRIMFFYLIKDAFCGKGLLFHLWFLAALIILYYMKACTRWLGKYVKFSLIVISLIICMALSFVFIINIIIKQKYNVEIRDIVPPCLRVITNGGFFILGFYLKDIDEIKYNRCILVVALLVSILSLNLLSYMTNNIWASSMYPSIPVFLGVVILFLLVTRIPLKFSSNKIKVLSTSTGIWILHPFILRMINKICRGLFGEITICGKIAIVIETIAISGIITYYMKKNKYLSFLVKI